jgi:redox-sensitive bicupin YhaK (pirin superfamily)
MKLLLHPENTRGKADYGWLKPRYSFSFSNYYDPQRLQFGLLRVLNDDTVAAGMGFGTHPHDNMEIVTIPLSGSLEHKDSMGTSSVITAGEVQIMSAGTGITHSEFNHSKTEELKLLQLWVFPKERNIKPRYDQKKYAPETRRNKFQTMVSPVKGEDMMWINQDAFFSMASIDKDKEVSYSIQHPGNGAYVFIIEGKIWINGQLLNRRDAIGITETGSFTVKAEENAEVLVVEVPMK